MSLFLLRERLPERRLGPVHRFLQRSSNARWSTSSSPRKAFCRGASGSRRRLPPSLRCAELRRASRAHGSGSRASTAEGAKGGRSRPALCLYAEREPCGRPPSREPISAPRAPSERRLGPVHRFLQRSSNARWSTSSSPRKAFCRGASGSRRRLPPSLRCAELRRASRAHGSGSRASTAEGAKGRVARDPPFVCTPNVSPAAVPRAVSLFLLRERLPERRLGPVHRFLQRSSNARWSTSSSPRKAFCRGASGSRRRLPPSLRCAELRRASRAHGSGSRASTAEGAGRSLATRPLSVRRT